MLYEIMLNGRVITTVSSFDEAQETFREEIGRPISRNEWRLLFSQGLNIHRNRYFAEIVSVPKRLLAAA